MPKSSEIMDTFNWTVQTERAAQLIADADLTFGEIAEELDISPRTLWNWRQQPEFAAKIEEHLEAFRVEVRRLGLAVRERRIKALNTRWKRLQEQAEVLTGDLGILKELREIEKQAAQELGQWTEKHEVEQTSKVYVTVSPEDL